MLESKLSLLWADKPLKSTELPLTKPPQWLLLLLLQWLKSRLLQLPKSLNKLQLKLKPAPMWTRTLWLSQLLPTSCLRTCQILSAQMQLMRLSRDLVSNNRWMKSDNQLPTLLFLLLILLLLLSLEQLFQSARQLTSCLNTSLLKLLLLCQLCNNQFKRTTYPLTVLLLNTLSTRTPIWIMFPQPPLFQLCRTQPPPPLKILLCWIIISLALMLLLLLNLTQIITRNSRESLPTSRKAKLLMNSQLRSAIFNKFPIQATPTLLTTEQWPIRWLK